MNCMTYKEVDRIPDMEFGAWDDNFPVWQEQGMPDWVKSNNEFDEYFKLETFTGGPPMMIELSDRDLRYCVWMDSAGTFHSRWFKHDELSGVVPVSGRQ